MLIIEIRMANKYFGKLQVASKCGTFHFKPKVQLCIQSSDLHGASCIMYALLPWDKEVVTLCILLKWEIISDTV